MISCLLPPRFATRRTGFVFLLLGLSWILVAAADPYARIAAANRNYALGNYEEALRDYGSALETAPDAVRPELLHNIAAAHYKLGNLQDAREAWVRAAGMRDAKFEAAARYNLGNCDYAEALRIASDTSGQTDAARIVELLERAQRQYLDAVALDPSLQNARANLELAEQLIRFIRENTTTQPSSQPSQSDGSDESTQSTSQPQQDSQSQEHSSSQPQEGDSNSSDPESGSPSTQSSEPQPEQDAQPPQSQPSEQPQSDEEPATQPDKQQDSSADPHDPLSETQPAQQPQTQPFTEDAGDSESPAQRTDLKMTPAEAERLLQKIRDAEKQRRQRLLQRERAKQRPVDRDW